MTGTDPEYQIYLQLLPKGSAAIAANETFVANAATVTFPLSAAAQQALVNQVVALTHQTTTIIRMLLGILDSADGT